ncbi:hypothetical protein PN471_10455 [Aphanizomenon sp. CS-733/32]|uniref:hypothetical protein n=1 Tax=Aphanizomenon sp. CS-733/32 TaxID=3021715 RepID=UPI00232E05AE|nr:hypothetical protein [Aphanizomenon sp. CS-733/32]MDB9309052.1 hypothetical protein [Aphanizomenon sp. CS-733/32]
MIALGDVGSAIAFHKSKKRSRFGEMALMKERRSLSWLFLPHFPRAREFFCLLDWLLGA